jgi:ABC-type nitrate/sulfonate/bicarbonate transport system permease component
MSIDQLNGRFETMSFSEEDIEALGQQLNLVNTHLVSLSDNITTIKNILLGFFLAAMVGIVFTFLISSGF